MPRGVPGSGPTAGKFKSKGKPGRPPKSLGLSASSAGDLTPLAAASYLASLVEHDRNFVLRVTDEMVALKAGKRRGPKPGPRAKRRTKEEMAAARAQESAAKAPATKPKQKAAAPAPAPKPKPKPKTAPKPKADDIMARKKAKAARLTESYGEPAEASGEA